MAVFLLTEASLYRRASVSWMYTGPGCPGIALAPSLEQIEYDSGRKSTILQVKAGLLVVGEPPKPERLGEREAR